MSDGKVHSYGRRVPLTSLPKVGTWHQREEELVPYLGEYAGHNEEWRLHVADSPLHLVERRVALALRPATRVYYGFYNRIGAHGSMTVDREPHEGTHAISLDPYTLARYVVEGRVTLEPGFEVQDTGGVYSSGCGSSAGQPILVVVGPEGKRWA